MSLRSIACRVKDFFQRKPAAEGGEDAVMPQKVSPLRPARLPNEIPYVIPKIIQQLRERRAKMLTRESQKPLPLPKDPEIIPSKIHRWRLQEHHHVVRKIQEISKYQPSSRHYKIAMISDLSEDGNIRNPQSELWEEALKSKEERHFQLGRITNFFS